MVHRTLHAANGSPLGPRAKLTYLQGIRRTPPNNKTHPLPIPSLASTLPPPPSLVPSVGLINVLLSWVLDIECLVAPNLKRPVHYVRSVRRRPDNLLLCIVQYSTSIPGCHQDLSISPPLLPIWAGTGRSGDEVTVMRGATVTRENLAHDGVPNWKRPDFPTASPAPVPGPWSDDPRVRSPTCARHRRAEKPGTGKYLLGVSVSFFRLLLKDFSTLSDSVVPAKLPRLADLLGRYLSTDG